MLFALTSETVQTQVNCACNNIPLGSKVLLVRNWKHLKQTQADYFWGGGGGGVIYHTKSEALEANSS